jgi:hypothetical protein
MLRRTVVGGRDKAGPAMPRLLVAQGGASRSRNNRRLIATRGRRGGSLGQRAARARSRSSTPITSVVCVAL